MAQKPPTASAPRDTLTLTPTPTPGYQTPGNPEPNPGQPGFKPRPGEGNAAARTRAIEGVLAIAAANGQSPARNG